MSSEFLSGLYKYAVIALAVVAVWHLVNRGNMGGKSKHTQCAAGSPADMVNPNWWVRTPVRGPKVARPHGDSRRVAGF